MDNTDRLNALDEVVRRRIKDITSAYVRADAASKEGNDTEELKHLLYAVQNISGLLMLKFGGRIDDCTAYEYARSLESSAQRIRKIFREGF